MLGQNQRDVRGHQWLFQPKQESAERYIVLSGNQTLVKTQTSQTGQVQNLECVNLDRRFK